MPFLLLLALAALEEPSPRAALLRDFRRSGDFVAILGAESPETEARMRAALLNLPLRGRGTLLILDAAEATEAALARAGVILAGTVRSNPWIGKVAGRLPLGVGEKGIRLRQTLYDSIGDSLQLLYPSPFQPGKPLFLFTGNGDEAVLDALTAPRRGDFQIRRHGATLVLGRFRNDWSLDPSELRVLGRDSVPPSDLFRGFDQARNRLARLLGSLPQSPPPEVRFYSSLEEKGLVTDDTRPAHFEGSVLHAASGAGREAGRLLVERLLETRIDDVTLRRGLSAWSVSTESELDAFDGTSHRLARLHSPPRLASLGEESPFVLEAMSASFVRFLLRERGPETLRAAPAELPDLERLWLESLEPDEPSPRPALSRFQRGFTLAHEGFEIHDGYLAARADRSLEKLRSLGVDSVAIVPYAFVSEPSRIGSLSVPARPGSETDEAVIHAVEAAKTMGLRVLLKPQIWLRRSWPGEIEAREPEEEERFFREYGRWIRHYALLAERSGVDLLSIGTELSKMTRRPRTARWETLIGDVRALYRGPLVYAANWGEEVEQVEFWPLLDFIGVDFYYPLSAEDSPSDEALRDGFERSLEPLRALSARLGKPVLLTDIGYGSTRSPWKSPHASDHSRELSPDNQARAYEAAFKALADETSWIRGIYWWKWPTDLSLGGAGDPGFTPNGKPAEDVVRRWYGSRIE